MGLCPSCSPRKTISASYRMRSSSLLPGLALLLPVTLAFESDAYTLFEKLNTVPRGWVLDSAEPDPSDVITLRVHVKQQNVETFEKKLIDVRHCPVLDITHDTKVFRSPPRGILNMAIICKRMLYGKCSSLLTILSAPFASGSRAMALATT